MKLKLKMTVETDGLSVVEAHAEVAAAAVMRLKLKTAVETDVLSAMRLRRVVTLLWHLDHEALYLVEEHASSWKRHELMVDISSLAA